MIVLYPFTLLGRFVISLFNFFGELYYLLKEVVYSIFFGQRRLKQVLRQIAEIGFRSQPVVIVTGCFTGSVLTAQSLFQMSNLKMETMAGGLVSVAMLRELGPVITGLMLCGRVGAAMAAEIGTMKVTEQIDALRSMNIHPIDYLVVPRFIAIAIAMPLLIAEAAFFGILLSTLYGVGIFAVNYGHWLDRLNKHTNMEDILISLIKGCVFGMLIVVISCNQGLNVSNGAVGVGRGTTNAMVQSALAIIIANFFLTVILNQFWPLGFV
jgi:phospholipid/cholesterol/gamma-HCH transport system permease protein